MDNIEVIDLLDNELNPQINKLRFVRDLAENSIGECCDEEEGRSFNGLHQLLSEVTSSAYDHVYEKLSRRHEEATNG